MKNRKLEVLEPAKPKVDAEEWLKQRFADPARELTNYFTLEEKVDLLAVEVIELRQSIKDLKSSWGDIDAWFRKSVSSLADDAVKEFLRLRAVAEVAIESQAAKQERLEFEKNVHRAVEAKFDEEAPKLAKAIFEAIKNQIQPHALKQR